MYTKTRNLKGLKIILFTLLLGSALSLHPSSTAAQVENLTFHSNTCELGTGAAVTVEWPIMYVTDASTGEQRQAEYYKVRRYPGDGGADYNWYNDMEVNVLFDTGLQDARQYQYAVYPETEQSYSVGYITTLTCSATLSVTSNSSASWTITESGGTSWSGTGTSASYTRYPAAGGTTYSINVTNPTSNFSVTNTDDGTTSLILSPDNNKGFAIAVTQDLPAITFWAEPTTVATGNTSTLRWTTNNVSVTTCKASGVTPNEPSWPVGQQVGGSGSTRTVNPIAPSTTYIITCTNTTTNQSANASVTVDVVANAPVVDLKINNQDNDIVVSGESFSYLAQAQNASSYCELKVGSTVIASSNSAEGHHPGAGGTVSSGQSGYPTAGNPKVFTYTCGSLSDSIAVSFGGPGAFDFAIPFPGDLVVVQGESVSNTINANLLGGAAQNVSFSMDPAAVLALPSGASASFSPGSCMLSCSTTLTFQTSASTPLGSHEVGVRGTATGGLTRGQTFFVTVIGPEDEPSNNPTATISANPTSIQSGGSSTLSWSSTNATSCTASGGWSGAKATSGSQSVSPASTATYTITCSGASGTTPASASATVTVGSSVSLTLTATPTSIDPGGSSTLSWSSTNATSCTATGGWSGTKPTSGNQSVSPSSTTNYGIFCSNATTGTGKEVTVTVGGDEPSSFNYSLSNSGTTSITTGGTTTYGQNVITKTLSANPTQSVDLTVSGVPSGVTYSISNRTCSPTCQSSILFSVSPGTSGGTYPITVTGSPLGRTTQFNLVLTPSDDIVVSCSASPTSPLIGQSVTWTASVSGGVPPYTYSWSGTNVPTSPAPSTNPFSITYSTTSPPPKTAQVIVTDSLGSTGSCSPAGSVNVNFDPRFEEF